ncbi:MULTISPECIES: LysR substrate-binding domain-containing protein [Achromobacter]|uniref:LysR substrate-binding domain-containing protein n=1 Tax=Achromobacter aegrifaciens TaxID=1287736 RepID=A0ABU2DIH2_ACHAE|nr:MULTISPECIES: LysR substrate-binding domain-containing protein [Achromobacter]MBD9383950.1 LysR family transcriptional regulator [Achromobacter sp. ACM02]MBD9476586.1 LysR family transcriptional regulator [Achromobacter sp. ACM01]MDR7947838.1 LysR substrate-binding domain-containing protein [Achromobacter aegrifaciens]CAB3702680.1 Glycine cleavage system transcriptional activator [Achromobacter aegrifaciens]
MRLHSPSMSELHAFVTAARLGSFTRAAEVLCVTQGAVSRAISRLEAHFGQPLMHRNAHGLTLTETGRRLYDGTLGPLQQIESLSAGLRANDRRLRLTLSTVPTLASAWLVPRLSDFHARHPDIQLSFAAYRRNEDFSGETPDASILSGMPEQWPGWQVDYVIGRELVVICHPARLAARRAQGLWDTPAGLLGEPLLYHSNGMDNWAQWLAAAGVPRASVQLSNGFDQVSILVRAVMADMGIAVLQRCLVRDDLQAGRVVAPFPDLPIRIDRGYHLCAPAQRRDHYALACFRRWLLETAGQDPDVIAASPA